MAQNYKALPALSKCSRYDTWLKEVKIWQCFTDISVDKQAPAIFLTLEGKAREAVLELEIEKLNSNTGVANLIKKLDDLYKKDAVETAYQAYDAFEQFKRPSDMNVSDYLIEFERLLHKTKAQGCTVSDNILAYRVLKSANLSPQQ